MNREIKFRVWDDKKKRIRPVKGIHWFKHTDIFVPVDGEDNCNECVVDAKLMQYTGLKDKNGKEIYESDLVRMMSGEIVKVVFIEASFLLKRICVDDAYAFMVPDNGEVIGNIHENPELLE